MRAISIIVLMAIFPFSSHGAQNVGTFTEEHLCKAGIATNNAHSTKNIKTLSNESDIISIAYTRDDGKIFGYSCKIEGNEIRWRDKTMNRWSKNIKLYYDLSNNGKQLDISSAFMGETMKKSFTLNDF